MAAFIIRNWIVSEVPVIKDLVHIDFCTPNEFPKIIDCQDTVVSELVHPEFYYPSAPHELTEFLTRSPHLGFIAGAYFSKQLIGFASVTQWSGPYYGYPCKKNRNYYSIEDTIVLKNFRGNGLQRKLWEFIIINLPLDAILLCTIHPGNTFCLNNAIALGFSPQKIAHPFGTAPRLILEREANKQNLRDVCVKIDLLRN